ncbi:hypothetical protein NFA_31450 [Nocardia farcinica IFM 10152]|uniref:Uncharacterized protein n=1 Tax=Nocardia farcinica (strain IFM 10152) TaxID=247156 RepID=Q5YUZ9_NOCFA|nr:hypothetical protein NFA_31450 [Nocardia farcinica IFM 10152]
MSSAYTSRSRARSATTERQYRLLPLTGCSSTIGVRSPTPERRPCVLPKEVGMSKVSAGSGHSVECVVDPQVHRARRGTPAAETTTMEP